MKATIGAAVTAIALLSCLLMSFQCPVAIEVVDDVNCPMGELPLM